MFKIIILLLIVACTPKEGKQEKSSEEVLQTSPIAAPAPVPSSPQAGSTCVIGVDPGFITRVRYREASVPSGSCSQETQYSFCQNGRYSSFTGSFTHESCSVQTATSQGRSCGNLAHGQTESRIRYQASSVAFGQQCVFETQTRQCNDGLLGNFSGTYTATTCFVMSAQTCNGAANGQTITRVRYNVPVARQASGCVAETQVSTCMNGTYSNYTGTFEFDSCRVVAGNQDPQVLFNNARNLLDTRCLNCHGGLALYPDFNIRPGASLDQWRAIMNQNSGLILTGSRWYNSEILTRTRFHFKGGDARTMPPSGAWSEQDYIRVADWIFSLPNELEAAPNSVEPRFVSITAQSRFYDVSETFSANSFEQCQVDQKGSPQKVTRLSQFEYRRTVEDLVRHFFKEKSETVLADLKLSLEAIPKDPQFEAFGDKAPSTSNQRVDERRHDEYYKVAFKLAKHFEEQLNTTMGECSDRQKCVFDFLNNEVVHFTRRPLRLDEIQQYLQIYNSNSLSAMLTRILLSPSFLFLAPDLTGLTSKNLNAYELASRLSYALWSSKPDQALLDLAQTGELLNDAVYSAQARRLLQDQKAQEAIAYFVSEWLRLDEIDDSVSQTQRQNIIKEVQDHFVQKIFSSDNKVSTFSSILGDAKEKSVLSLAAFNQSSGQVQKAVKLLERLMCLETLEPQKMSMMNYLSSLGQMSDVSDVGEAIAESFYAHRCFSQVWWRRVNRRIENLNQDACHLQSIYEKLEDSNGGIKEALIQSVTHPNFKFYQEAN